MLGIVLGSLLRDWRGNAISDQQFLYIKKHAAHHRFHQARHASASSPKGKHTTSDSDTRLKLDQSMLGGNCGSLIMYGWWGSTILFKETV